MMARSVVRQRRHVGVELLDGVVELGDFARLVADEAGQQGVQGGGVGEVGARSTSSPPWYSTAVCVSSNRMLLEG